MNGRQAKLGRILPPWLIVLSALAASYGCSGLPRAIKREAVGLRNAVGEVVGEETNGVAKPTDESEIPWRLLIELGIGATGGSGALYLLKQRKWAARLFRTLTTLKVSRKLSTNDMNSVLSELGIDPKAFDRKRRKMGG